VLAHFEGALQHAPDEILASWESDAQYVPAFSHDLEMVVRTVFHCTNMMTFQEIAAEDDPEKLRAFWAHHLAPAFWKRMLTAAQACDYDALKAIIAELLPGQVPTPLPSSSGSIVVESNSHNCSLRRGRSRTKTARTATRRKARVTTRGEEVSL
jgi:hypothetical protein